MSFRCSNAFAYGPHVYAGGCEVQDDDPILTTHGDYFVRVGEPPVHTETASAAPGEVRVAHRKAPVKKAAPKKLPEPKSDEPEGEN